MFGPESVTRKSLSSVTTLLIGLFVFFSIPSQIEVFDAGSGSRVNARTLPYLISSAIIVLSLLMIASNIVDVRKKQTLSSKNEQKEVTSYGRVLLAFAAIALWIILLPYLGFNITTILLVASVMIIIGNCRWWQIVILPLLLSIPVNYLLAIAMGVYLPGGSLFG